MLRKTVTILTLLLAVWSAGALGEDNAGTRPMLVATPQELQGLLPPDTTLLQNPVTLEQFLAALDGTPPDWAGLHGGHGTHPSERLFALNRERDGRRAGREALARRITFLWDGVLSGYVPDKGGFPVAIGPETIATTWGIVRFKPENLPAELVAAPPAHLKESLERKVARGEQVPVIVAMTGRLVPDESLIYDFAHEDPGQGMVMPMVRVERIDYLLAP
jgi:hypothetical protein